LLPYLAFGKAQFVKLLQIHPELRTGAKPMPKTQRCIGGDTALAVDDAGDPVHRHVDLPRKLRRADAKLAQFFRQMFAGVDGRTGHKWFPSVVIDDLNVNRTQRSVRPCEANPPLIVDSYRKLSGAISFEGLQPISRQGRQISQTRRSIQSVKTKLGLFGETRELPHMPAGSKPLGTPVAEANDHLRTITSIYELRK
jgi:hypothetical protein